MPTNVETVRRVLLLDTCALLDIVRFASHSRPQIHLDAVQRLVGLAENDPAVLVLALVDVVSNELGHNRAPVIEAERQAVGSIVDRALSVSSLSASLGRQSLTDASRKPDSFSAWHLDLVTALDSLVDRILAVAEVVDVTEDDRNAADQRVRDRVPPAAQGSSGTYDCQITEVALRVAASRAPSSTLFLSSNTRDFCDGAALHPTLQGQFDDAGLVFVKAWGEARGALHDLF
ncbi:hypothetical protein BMS3Bbin01_02059 [bacterium BMS3Bbin01]|nr:hypothetical protein BMS3Bbin01_02059 [bacterium BMS3Bbin01]